MAVNSGNGSNLNGKSRNGHTSNGYSPNQNGYLAGLRERLAPPLAPARYAHIVGWGMDIPDTVVTNTDLEAVVETTDEWIRTRTGIQERRVAGDRESVVTLGFEAARAALDRADILPSEIDLIIVATSTPEDIYPSTACKIQNRLGSTKAGAFDLSAACSGFVYALNMAAQAIRSGSIETALVIGAEINSRVMDWSDRSTCILFGDGAGAVVLQGRDEPGGLLSCVLGSDGSGAELLGIPTVGYAALPEGRQLHKLHMDGREVFRFATHIINESVREVVGKAGLKMSDIALIVPHQANQRILSAAARSLNVPESLFYSNVHRYGNTSAASIPIALCEAEREGRLKSNDHIVLIGFGGGLTWAAAAIQWQVVPVRKPQGVTYRLSQSRREAMYIMAFWRTRILRIYRRVEAWLKGSPVKTAQFRRDEREKPQNGVARERDTAKPTQSIEKEREKERTREREKS
jgi:3-oxoacyl-[acyl-carrier-protein] synthase-3